MHKRITKLVSIATAVVSVLGVGFLSACKGSYKWDGVSTDATASQVSSNGGFLVETGDYAYFINGVASNSANNDFGNPVRGSIQRISKADIKAHNYNNTQTVVPLIVYSGNYNSGIYIYDNNIYYSTPSTEKNSDGEVQYQYVEFKSSSLNGKTTMKNNYARLTGSDIKDYRYVKGSDGVVYLMYVASENLYGSVATNIHSVNTKTGKNTLLAYNVSEYTFDTENLENGYVYYVMGVTENIGTSNSIAKSYNQVYRVSPEVTSSPRTYDFSYVEDYSKDKNPVYVNYGEFVLDGIGKVESGNDITQFNYNYGSTNTYNIDHPDYNYELAGYKNGVLYLERTETSISSLYSVLDLQVSASGWDAILSNDVAESNSVEILLTQYDHTDYIPVSIGGVQKVLYAGNNGLEIGQFGVDGVTGVNKIVNNYTLTSDGSAAIISVREEGGHVYAYYSLTGGNGYTFYRVAIDGARENYASNVMQPAVDYTYQGVRILDIDAVSSWYKPEFVEGQIIFASETEGVSSYNYIMACDISKNNVLMTNEEIHEYTEQYEAVMTKINDYDKEENSDGTGKAYENLSNALKYVYYTGDVSYLNKLIKAYVDIENKSDEYIFSKESVTIYTDFLAANGDWAEYKSLTKNVNGHTVYGNNPNYYYGIIGKVASADKQGMQDYYKSAYTKAYPENNQTWWQGLTTVAKVFFIIGMVVAGLLVIGGGVILTLWLIKRSKAKADEKEIERFMVDMTDDKDIDVYADDENHVSQE